jgi:hypothetical protein
MNQGPLLTRKARVLLLSASLGAGEVLAAQAPERALLLGCDFTVEHVDVLS